MKRFNITGQCVPNVHYMVNTDEKLAEIKTLIDDGFYFLINRARQYGKTTTLKLLPDYLADDYITIFMSFQRLSAAKFKDEYTFAAAFAEFFLRTVRNAKKPIKGFSEEVLEELRQAGMEREDFDMVSLFNCLSDLCSSAQKPVVLLIDEVDSASNNQVFLDFLAQLREFYLERYDIPTFQSVILAGVYDIKNLKQKIRPEAEHRYNSPWNIAAKFDVDMSFSPEEIAGMLRDYESDKHTGMNICDVSQCIYDYTSGYPFLVSYICKILDEEVTKNERFKDVKAVWTEAGISEAVRLMLMEPNVTLFDSMMKQLDRYPELNSMLSQIIYQGKTITYNPDVEVISIGVMFGFLVEKKGLVAIANRIFEMRMLNKYVAEESASSGAFLAGTRVKNQFISNDRLDMDLVMSKFVDYYTEVFRDNDQKFVEEQGRKIFLMYLKPIINGTGNAYLEAETRNLDRTDLIVDYLGTQYIIEMKIWRGDSYNTRGEQQICGYLDAYRRKKGYLLSFNFNKNKTSGVQILQIGDKTIVEAVV